VSSTKETPVEARDLPVLEVPCEKCKGRGWYSYGGGQKEPCPVCDGAGYEPTAFGDRILALMRHNLKPMLQDAQDG
jgi:DnaJ-class molecular chaperone